MGCDRGRVSSGKEQCGVVVRPDCVARLDSKGADWFGMLILVSVGNREERGQVAFARGRLECLHGGYEPVDGIKHRLRFSSDFSVARTTVAMAMNRIAVFTIPLACAGLISSLRFAAYSKLY